MGCGCKKNKNTQTETTTQPQQVSVNLTPTNEACTLSENLQSLVNTIVDKLSKLNTTNENQ
jgi:metal-sulfur cluster biosynthetic enzyme